MLHIDVEGMQPLTQRAAIGHEAGVPIAPGRGFAYTESFRAPERVHGHQGHGARHGPFSCTASDMHSFAVLAEKLLAAARDTAASAGAVAAASSGGQTVAGAAEVLAAMDGLLRSPGCRLRGVIDWCKGGEVAGRPSARQAVDALAGTYDVRSQPVAVPAGRLPR